MRAKLTDAQGKRLGFGAWMSIAGARVLVVIGPHTGGKAIDAISVMRDKQKWAFILTTACFTQTAFWSKTMCVSIRTATVASQVYPAIFALDRLIVTP